MWFQTPLFLLASVCVLYTSKGFNFLFLFFEIAELPRVRWVLPDSYLNVKEKDYGGNVSCSITWLLIMFIQYLRCEYL